MSAWDDPVAHIRELEAEVERLRAAVKVHEDYFDLDGFPGFDDTTPEPEDVWRFDRDFRRALGLPEEGL